MTHRPRALRRARLGTVVAVAAALAATAPTVAASAQSASDSAMTLKLNHFDRNSGLMNLQAPFYCTCEDVDADVYNGDTKMQPILDGTERGYVSGDFVYLGNLKRGATYHLSVKYTDKQTHAVVLASNTVTLTTPPSDDTTPPTAPTGVGFFTYPPPNYPDFYGVSWNPSSDDVDPQSDLQYVIKRNGQVTGINTEAHKGDTFTVTAIDKSNNARESAPVVFDGTTTN